MKINYMAISRNKLIADFNNFDLINFFSKSQSGHRQFILNYKS